MHYVARAGERQFRETFYQVSELGLFHPSVGLVSFFNAPVGFEEHKNPGGPLSINHQTPSMYTVHIVHCTLVQCTLYTITPCRECQKTLNSSQEDKKKMSFQCQTAVQLN